MTFDKLPHPRALAFLGDAVFEIMLRERAVERKLSQSRDLHAYTTRRANAVAQVNLLNAIKAHLTEAEQDIIRQGRNMGVGTGRRSDQAMHRQATGFEALLGALYLTDRERLYSLWAVMQPHLEEAAQGIPDRAEELAEPGNETPQT